MKKKTKRVVPALLSLVMAVSSVPGPAYAAPLVTLFSSAEDDTQMVSDAETVFVNFYDGSVRSQDFNSNWKFFREMPAMRRKSILTTPSGGQ